MNRIFNRGGQTVKIALFSLEKVHNIGDELLCATTEFLIHKVDHNIECVHCELLPQNDTIPSKYKLEHFLGNVIKFFVIKLGEKGERQYRNIAYKIQYYRYFKNVIKSVDKIIYPVGMLNYSTQHFSYVYHMINKIAEKYNKPVLMSAMSIEKPDERDWRYHQIRKAVNFSSVKYITTRDGKNGLDRLKDVYLERELKTDYVGDPALWSPEMYGIKKNLNSKVIGINLIRSSIYNDYKEDKLTADELVSFYKELITIITQKGYDFELFCNGMDADYQVGQRIIQEMRLPQSKLLPKLQTGLELLNTISGYKAVFGARLHACIVSVALGIPVAGMLWDNKLNFFSETMGIRQFFSSVQELKGNLVLDKLEAAMKYDFDFENRDAYKMRTYESIKRFVTEM